MYLADTFFPKRLTLHSSYSFTFDQLLLSLGRHRGTDGTEAVRHRGSYVRVHHSRLRKTDDSHTVQEEVDKRGKTVRIQNLLKSTMTGTLIVRKNHRSVKNVNLVNNLTHWLSCSSNGRAWR